MHKLWAEKLSSISKFLLLIGIIVSALHIFRISQHAYLTDSEIWGISSSKNFWLFTSDAAGTLMKPLFHSILNLFFLFSKTSVDVFLNTRALAAFNGVAVLFLTAYFCKKLTQSNFAAAFSGAFLASSYHFLLWFPSVRADSFSSLPLLVGFFLILSSVSAPHIRPNLKLIIISQIAALLITPKAVFLVLLQWLLFFKFIKRDHDHLTFSRQRLVLFLSTISLFCAALLSLTNASLYFANTFDFFLSAFYSKEIPYFSIRAFYYVFRFIIEDFILAAASVFALSAYTFVRERQSTRYFIITLFIWGLFIFYNERLPFFISSLLPLLSLTTTCLIFFIFKNNPRCASVHSRLFIFPTAALILTAWLYFINIKAFESTELQFSNAKQIKTLNILEAALDNDLLTWDAIGLLPNKNVLFAYLGTENGIYNNMAAERVMHMRPQVVFLVGRTLVYWPQIQLWLRTNYIDIGNGVWLVNEAVNNPKAQPLILASKNLPENLITLFQFNTQY